MGRGCAVHSLVVRRPCRFGQQPRTWLPRNNSFAGDRAALPISESGFWLLLFAQPLRPRTPVTDPHVLLVACVPPQAPRLRPFKRSSLFLSICWLACLVSASQAKEKCGAEVKLLLIPSELHSALESFNAARETTGSVYFFDTNTLELLSEGVILRLRSGAASDLTVKLRLPATLEGRKKVGIGDRYKCETDLTGDLALRSYSVQTKFTSHSPATGQELFELLSTAQKQLLAQAHVSVDWSRVERIAEMKATDWEIKGQPLFPKLILELWEWRTGKILELSTRVADDTSSSAYVQLRQIVLAKGLSLNKYQKPKTTLVLEDIGRMPARLSGTQQDGKQNQLQYLGQRQSQNFQ